MTYNEDDNNEITQTINIENTYAEYSPGGDDDLEGDWDDEDDEVFDDMADDREDLHDIIIEDDIPDEEDDDHLPEDDF